MPLLLPLREPRNVAHTLAGAFETFSGGGMEPIDGAGNCAAISPNHEEPRSQITLFSYQNCPMMSGTGGNQLTVGALT
jgi:hypothetical protein